jgi:beta-glucanase (GH16 family)
VSGRAKRVLLASALIALSLAGAYAVFAANTIPNPSRPTAVTPTTGSPNTPFGPPGAWELAFSDRFGGTALDTSKWSTCFYWDCTNRTTPEQEWYQASQVTVDNGVLSLTAMPEQTHGRQYVSGLVSSYGKFSYTYGYAQIVAKMPVGRGLWSIFWAEPTSGTWPPEFDIMENWAQEDTVNFVVHYNQSDWEETPAYVPTLSKAFHTYGLDWEPGRLTWYVDGIEQVQYNISISTPMYLIANLAVATNPGPDDKVQFPQSLKIHSIQVWEHPLAASSTTSP